MCPISDHLTTSFDMCMWVWLWVKSEHLSASVSLDIIYKI